MKNIDGGKAFAEGAYGCVFRPSLKCKNEKERKNGVSKLMLVDKAFSEYNEIKKFIKVLSKIPNFRSLFMFPYNDVDATLVFPSSSYIKYNLLPSLDHSKEEMLLSKLVLISLLFPPLISIRYKLVV